MDLPKVDVIPLAYLVKWLRRGREGKKKSQKIGVISFIEGPFSKIMPFGFKNTYIHTYKVQVS